MAETLLATSLHAASLWLGFAGMAWLALAMEAHWEHVRTDRHQPAAARRLRVLGAAALAASLALCLWADTPGLAALVWPMNLAASALAVALLLAWRPRWLRPLARVAGRAPAVAANH
ncbi:DUF3325 family protein [Comamonadaceae bacterium OH2545_COT-014]|nr:DUF3325 family protein [Comamonadaceae bacterium OH2545_COT-014]